MDRTATPAFIAELLQSTNSPCFLAELYFASGTARMTDAWRTIVWSANTYVATGHYMGISGLQETADLSIPSLTLSLSGVDQAYVSVALLDQYLDRRLVIYKALLDYTQSVVSSPIIIFDGRMDGISIADEPGGTTTVVITATSQWADFERKPGRHTNSAEQGVWFPGDKFFDYCSQGTKPNLKWGST